MPLLLFLLLAPLLPAQQALNFANLRATTLRYLTCTEARCFEAELLDPQAEFDLFERDLTRIQSLGFNAVWQVFPLFLYIDEAAPTLTLNETRMRLFERKLALLRERRMRLFWGLNYLWPTQSPKGFVPQNWIHHPDRIALFDQIATALLRRAEPYADTVLPFVFVEGTEPDYSLYLDPAALTAYLHDLRTALGEFPTRLPADLRAKYRIGFHDYSILTLGWGRGASPLPDPHDFDFLSFNFYPQYGFDPNPIPYLPQNPVAFQSLVRRELEARIARFTRFYPNTPIIVGETGFSSCYLTPGHDAIQATAIAALLTAIREKNLAFNLWDFSPARGQLPDGRPWVCSENHDLGASLTKLDGSARLAACAANNLINGGDWDPQSHPDSCDLLGPVPFPNLLPDDGCRLPKSITGFGTSAVTPTGFSLFWDEIPPAPRLRVVLRISENRAEVLAGCPPGSTCAVKDDNVAFNRYTVTGLKPNTTYYARIAAVCGFQTPLQRAADALSIVQTAPAP
ncbi:MAG: fibronectin type III domain-containing protein [Bryobacterales bacterium]|nr:fibronectin type III domain-containing protein [Bryobacterales bacterium]